MILSAFLGETLFAQQEQPPQGIIVLRGGYRYMMDQTKKYDDSGKLVGLGDEFYTKLNIYEFLSDGLDKDDGSSLISLLKKIAGSNLIKPLLNQDLGEITGDVNAKVRAKYVALAFGITDRLTIALAPTWISAKVDVNMNYNENESIKKPLGGLVANYIKENFDSILDSYLTGMDYKTLDTWRYSGRGDTRLMLMYGRDKPWTRRLRSIQLFDLQLSLPTGYLEKPEILNDVTLERGYYHLSLRFLQKVVIKRIFWVDGSVRFGYSFPRTKEVRVPLPGSDQTLVGKDRQVKADWKPGHEFEFMFNTSGYLFGFIKPRFTLGYKQHLEDKYSGSLEGNWKKLSEGTASTQFYTEASLGIDTSYLYERKRFKVPFMIDMSYHHPLKAKNSNDERFLEFTLNLFIPTPLYPYKIF